MPGAVRTISVRQWAKEAAELGERWKEAAQRGLVEAGQRMKAIMQEKSQVLFNTGNFRRNWETSVSELRLTISNEAPYSGVLEEGRRPGSRMPPTQALVPWVKAKLQPVIPKGRNPDSFLRGLAFVVGRAIGRRGLPRPGAPAHILEEAIPELEQVLVEEVTHSISEELGGESESASASGASE